MMNRNMMGRSSSMMGKIWPMVAAAGVGFAAYQMFSKRDASMKDMLPIATGMMGMSGGESMAGMPKMH
ncbi:hypothetical protein ACFFJY_02490 [Fictibacillus aquaticus]|uniref:Uncharacterized protein n=1 Tax=Fictibacillus aquaticus TaxID=2021314 RepID=A0A235F980_9BACL|nr:hypothetical protein [Fictibacillus aquaticus]OYD57573.1 hypothetical protein CGZ90_12960 [Fictibacillus aquaticus]